VVRSAFALVAVVEHLRLLPQWQQLLVAVAGQHRLIRLPLRQQGQAGHGPAADRHQALQHHPGGKGAQDQAQQDQTPRCGQMACRFGRRRGVKLLSMLLFPILSASRTKADGALAAEVAAAAPTFSHAV